MFRKMVPFLILIFPLYVAGASSGIAGAGDADVTTPTTLTSPDSNSTTCTAATKLGHFRNRQKCILDFVKQEISNNKTTTTGTCDKEDVIKNYFRLTNTSASCYTNSSERVENSLQTRYALLKNAFAEGKVKKFFADGGLRCLKETGQKLIDNCVNNLGHLNLTYKVWIARTRPLIFNKPTCGRQSTIKNCIIGIVTNNCNKTQVEFVSYLHERLNDHCKDSMVTDDLNSSTKSSTPGIIVGCVLGLVFIVFIGCVVFMLRSKPRCPGGRRPETYNVAYQERDRSDQKQC